MPIPCAACGSSSPSHAKFCVECGTRLGRSCPTCGHPADSGKFCMECGTALDGAPRSPAAPTLPVSERRTTTVLFGDLVAFTSLSEARDPEEVRELLSAYFDVARTVVGRYGGTIEKFIGDAVMAVWGVPVAHEDDAERAVRAGLDLVAEVAALGAELGVAGLSMRAGLVTGSVAVTLGALHEGMVAGDAVNSAARVQSIAEPGTVWVDRETRSLTAAAIAFTDRGEHVVKGKAEPLHLFRADAVVAAVGGAQRVDGLEAPMVGRDPEMRALKELFHATEADGRARLVIVQGQAGVGKSRLGWEFEKYADGLSDVVRWHRGRSLSYGVGTSYWAFAEMVRSRLGLLESQRGVEVERAVSSYVDTLASSTEEATWLRARILALLGHGGTEFDRGDLFASWSTFLELLGGEDPVVLLFEDMQYADDGMLDLVEYLLRTCRARLFVVVLARPELVERRPSLAVGRRAVVVPLDPLPSASMDLLVDGLVADLPARARSALVARAEGIPLYAVETIRSLVDHQAVVARDGGHVFVDHDERLVDLARLTAPTSLRTLLSARLDALAAEERRVVQDASVLGSSFTRAGVVVLSGLGDRVVDHALDGLIRKGIVGTQDDPRSPEIGRFHFLQGIMREVARDTLSRRDRRERHLAAATHLGSESGEDTSAVIAQHLMDALAASVPDDPDRPVLEERARAQLVAAADRAAVLGSPEGVLGNLDRALDLGATGVERADLLQRAARAAFDGAQHARAEELAVEAERLDEELDRPVELLRTRVVRSRAIALQGRVQEGLRIMADVEEALGRQGIDDDRLRLQLLQAQAQAYGASADLAGQQAVALRQLVLAERLRDRSGISKALSTLAIVLADLGSVVAYEPLLLRAADIAREDGDLTTLVQVLTNLTAESYVDDLAAARRVCEESLEIQQRTGRTNTTEMTVLNLGIVSWLDGSWDELLTNMTSWFDEHEPTPLSGHLRLVEAQVRLARGLSLPHGPLVTSDDPWEQCATTLTEALRLAEDGDRARAAALVVPAMRAAFADVTRADDFELLWSVAVDVVLQVGDLKGARDLVDLGADLLAGRGRILARAETARVRARVAVAGDADPEADLRQAIDLHREYGAPFLRARSELELGRWLVGRGRDEEALGLLHEAREGFAALDAGPWTTRVDDVVPSVSGTESSRGRSTP